MRSKVLQYAVVLVVPLVLSFVITAGAAMNDMASNNDMAITSAVQQKLQSDNGLNSSNIIVETKNGEVTLKGVVSTEHDVNRAAKLAHYVDGVKHVDNRLTTEKAEHYKVKTQTPGCLNGASWC